MKCPRCHSTKIRKNGHRQRKQCYQCRACGRQFVESPKFQFYSEEIKQLCLKMYLNGMSLRGLERVTEIHHTTIMNWIKAAKIQFLNSLEKDEIPEDETGLQKTNSDKDLPFDELQMNKALACKPINHYHSATSCEK